MTQLNARAINRMIQEAEQRGRNVYASGVLNTIGLELSDSMRIIRAKTSDGVLKVHALASGNWYRVGIRTRIETR